ncbi:unnamed protein product, partial [Rotaria magnacalcarata]
FVNRRIKDRRALLQAVQTEAAAKSYGSVQATDETTVAADETSRIIPDDSESQPDVTFALALRHAFLPRTDTPWAERNLIN